MPENGINLQKNKKKSCIKILLFYVIISVAIFLIQRIFVKFTFDGGYLTYWDPYDIMGFPWDYGENWEYIIPIPFYIATFLSCAIGSIIINVYQPKAWYKNLIICEIVCVLAVLPTILIMLFNTKVLFSIYSPYQFSEGRDTIIIITFILVQVGIAIGIFIDWIITIIKNSSQYYDEIKKRKGIA